MLHTTYEVIAAYSCSEFWNEKFLEHIQGKMSRGIVEQEVHMSQIPKLNPTLQLIMVMLHTTYEWAAAYSC